MRVVYNYVFPYLVDILGQNLHNVEHPRYGKNSENNDQIKHQVLWMAAIFANLRRTVPTLGIVSCESKATQSVLKWRQICINWNDIEI